MSSSSRWPFILMSFGVGVGDGLGVAVDVGAGVAAGDAGVAAGDASGCCATTTMPNKKTRGRSSPMNRRVLVIGMKHRRFNLNYLLKCEARDLLLERRALRAR